MTSALALLFLVVVTNGVASIFIRLAGKGEKFAEIPTFYFNFFGGLAILFFTDQFPPFSSVWLFPIVAGFIYALGNVFMFKAYKRGGVSLLSPLGNLNPALIFLVSVILLKESVSLPKLAGVALIIYGLSFLKEQKNVISSLKAVFRDQSCQFYLLFLLSFAIARVIDKRAISYFQVVTYSFLNYSAAIVFLLILLALKGKLTQIVDYAKRQIGWAAGAGIAVALKYIAYLKAIS